jgi:hypothetical protein
MIYCTGQAGGAQPPIARRLLLYFLLPTIMIMTFGNSALGVSLTSSIPITSGSLSASANAFATPCSGAGNWISMWSAIVHPSRGRPSIGCNVWFPIPIGKGCQFHPLSLRVADIFNTKSQGSASGLVIAQNVTGANGLTAPAMRFFCLSLNKRGLRYPANSSVVCCSTFPCAMIVPRCNNAIRPSETNRPILNTVSSTTPTTTYQNAHLCTDVGYLSDSNIMPMPNNPAAAISACNKYGFAEERNASEKKEEIAGSIAGILLLVAGCGAAVWVLRRKMRFLDQQQARMLEMLKRH